jgi:hypothetical protein
MTRSSSIPTTFDFSRADFAHGYARFMQFASKGKRVAK